MSNMSSMYCLERYEVSILYGTVDHIVAVIFLEEVFNEDEVSLSVPLTQ